MPEHWITIDLFIADDGSFRPVTPENARRQALVEVRMVPMSLDANGPDPTEGRLHETIYRRYRLKVPCSTAVEQRIWTRPSRAWDNFLRHVIAEIELKGAVPWRTP